MFYNNNTLRSATTASNNSNNNNNIGNCGCEKSRCRLCDLLLVDQSKKLGGGGGVGGGGDAGACSHVPTSPQQLTQQPFGGVVGALAQPFSALHQQTMAASAFFLPQLRDWMLAAYLLKGYYQPAGPLISAHHPHTHVGPPPDPVLTTSSHGGKISVPLPSLETSPTPPLSQQPPAPSSAGESSDNDVIITASTSSGGGDTPHMPQPPPAPAYRYTSYSTPTRAPPGYATYGFPTAQYYTSPQYGPQQPPHYHHQDLCYSSQAPYQTYFHPKSYGAPTPGYHRRYIPAPPTQYYPEVFGSSQGGQQTTQVVTAAVSTTGSAGPGGTYAASPAGPPPPPPTLVETTYQPPAGPVSIVESYPGPPHYYTGYSTGPTAPPGCYSHSPPTRSLAFIDAAYQSCPCPMQSCPKNVHTGPLTGDGKRSNRTVIAKESAGLPLPPVALALPLEPASVVGPPSPARGSAGMPPPPSPAGATYQPVSTPKLEVRNNGSPAVADPKPATEKVRRKARVGKTMVRNTIASQFNRLPDNTMLLMCHNPEGAVKREATSPENAVIVVEKEVEKDTRVVPCIEVTTADTPQTEYPEPLTEVVKTSTDPDPCETNVPVIINTVEVSVPNIEITETIENRLTVCKEEIKIDPISPTTDTNLTSNSDKEEGTKENQDESIKTLCTKRKPCLRADDSLTMPVQKKQKSSYKDLIKKSLRTFKINNGKRKLNMESRSQIKHLSSFRKPKIIFSPRTKPKMSFKRKIPHVDEIGRKRFKSSRPLIASNLHNFKQNLKNNKVIPEPPENTAKVNSLEVVELNTSTVKKTAPACLDCLFNKNNVDRTIESVVLNTSFFDKPPTAPNISELYKVITDDEIIATKPCEPSVKPKPAAIAKPVPKGSSKRKTKSAQPKEPLPVTVPKVPRRSFVQPRWSNGWSWEGDPFDGKVFLNSDEAIVTRTCYPAMRHSEGDVVHPRDCVLLKSGPRKIDLPFVAKVAALWENPEDGEMMMSLLWYYRPEHTEQGRLPKDEPDEVFASRHKDTNSVACIEDKCYVLTFNEYCRYRKNVRRLEEGIEESCPIVPQPEGMIYPRAHRQPPASQTTSPDMVFFCRRVYDFRQKRIVKNPS